jgi:hypothetical protein
MNGRGQGPMNPAAALNVRAPRYAIASASAPCTNCGNYTHVIAVCLPARHEVLRPDDDGGEAWESVPLPAVVFQIEAMSTPCASRIATVSPHYRVKSGPTETSGGWLNHCENCGAEQADYDLHCEPDGAFSGIHGAARIFLLEIDAPFEASAAGYSLDPGLV